MKHLAIAAMCLVSTLANANDIEEITVTAEKDDLKIVYTKLSEYNRQNPETGEWHYVEKNPNRA